MDGKHETALSTNENKLIFTCNGIKMNERLLREVVRLVLEHPAPVPAAITRANKSKSAEPVTALILQHVKGVWQPTAMAVSHSSQPDLILSDGVEEVEVEVKDYGSTTFFKAEISLRRDSALARLFGMSLNAFSSGTNMLDRIKDYNPDEFSKYPDVEKSAAIKAKIAAAATSVGKNRSTVGRTIIDTKGKRSPRFISMMGGEPEDYLRVRHSSSIGSSPRMLYTATTQAVKDASSIVEGDPSVHDQLARAISADFTGDQYLALYDGKQCRVFTLKGNDPLDLGAPSLTGASISSWKFSTHGGELRPAVVINLNPDSGLILV